MLAAITAACQPPSELVATAAAPAASPAAPAKAAAAPESMQLLKPVVSAGYRVQYTLAGDLNRDA